MHCNLCGWTDFKLLYRGTLTEQQPERFAQYARYGDILRCRNCGLIHQKPGHSVDDIVELLAQERYLDEPIGQLNYQEKGVQFRRLISHMQRFVELADASVLDLGANTGAFLRECRAFTSHLAGIEPSQEAAKSCQNQGLDVRNCVIAQVDFGTRRFDVITMWDVVEHLYDPRADLATALRLLRPGGSLFISTHDVDGLFARLSGSRYPMLMYQHFFHFSPRTLSRMLDEIGFDVLDIQPFCKSWSAGYLRELLPKLWPDSGLASLLWRLSLPVSVIPGLAAIQLTVPVRNFFILTARRPC